MGSQTVSGCGLWVWFSWCVCRDEDSDSSDGEGGRRKRKREGNSSLFDEDFFEAEFRKRRKVRTIA